MIELTLYTTSGCHLCDALEGWLVRLTNDEVALARVEIADDEALMASYATRIPVLVDAEDSELDSGYQPERLAAWLSARGWLSEAAWRESAAQPDDKPGSRPGIVMRRGRRYLAI